MLVVYLGGLAISMRAKAIEHIHTDSILTL
jgi:hypothetical protein